MSQARILHLITRLDRGGSAKVVLRLSEGLRDQGFDVRIATGPTREPEEDLKGFTERTSIPIYTIPSLVRDISFLKDLRAFFDVFRLIRALSPTILHTHTTKAGFTGRIMGRICGVKAIVHTPHGHIFYGYGGRVASRLYILAERMASMFCDRIVALTDIEKDDYIRLKVAGAEKISVIPAGIELDNYLKDGRDRADMRRELGLSPNTILVGWVGRFEEIKGCFDFLEAAGDVAGRFQEVRFLMVGDGPLRGAIEEWIKERGLADRVILTGYRRDIPRVMKALDLYVLTSLNEGQGMGIVEAMAAGKPVVATGVGGVPSVVRDGETGILVPPGRADMVARALIHLLSNRALARRMGEEGRKRSLLFTVDGMVRAYLKVYRDLMKG